tara:strand:+ start:3552 stop:4076 length:525 start_codon:yes stop_codon:yes gene_type:complete
MDFRGAVLAVTLGIAACDSGVNVPPNSSESVAWSPDDVLDLLKAGDRRACDAALTLVAEEARRIEYEFGWAWVAEDLRRRTSITGRDSKYISFDPANHSMRCEAYFDVRWVDGTTQKAAPEPGADGYYLVEYDGGFVVRWTAPQEGAQWYRPQARQRYAVLRDQIISERISASQ